MIKTKRIAIMIKEFRIKLFENKKESRVKSICYATRANKSRSDDTLLTVDFNLRRRRKIQDYVVPQGEYNICDKVPSLFRKLKLTVNSVSSLRDLHKNVLPKPAFEIFNLCNRNEKYETVTICDCLKNNL